jgi:hypothetical protein
MAMASPEVMLIAGRGPATSCAKTGDASTKSANSSKNNLDFI